MSLEVELLHRIESLEQRVKLCEDHHHEGDYHEHLQDEDEIKSIVESHLKKASEEIEAASKAESSKSEEGSSESEPPEEPSSEKSEEKKEEKKEEARSEVEPNRRHFLHKKVGGKRAA